MGGLGGVAVEGSVGEDRAGVGGDRIGKDGGGFVGGVSGPVRQGGGAAAHGSGWMGHACIQPGTRVGSKCLRQRCGLVIMLQNRRL